jgi:hypothetical protein
MTTKKITLWVVAVLVALFLLAFLIQRLVEPAESEAQVKQCDQIGLGKKATGEIFGIDTGKTLFGARADMSFCWKAYPTGFGVVLSWTPVQSWGSTTTWGSAFGWRYDGLAVSGGPKCIVRSANGCGIVRAKRVHQFSQCVPVPTGDLCHRTHRLKFRFLAYSNGTSSVW